MRSKEQDILVIDASAEAPLFHQGDLAIAFPHTVIAAISIKTKMDTNTLKDVVEGLASVRKTARDCNCKGEPHFGVEDSFSALKRVSRRNPAEEVRHSLGKTHSPHLPLRSPSRRTAFHIFLGQIFWPKPRTLSFESPTRPLTKSLLAPSEDITVEESQQQYSSLIFLSTLLHFSDVDSPVSVMSWPNSQ